MAKSSRFGEAWTREELILAFELCCRIPFARTKASNPQVKIVADALGRTPSSVARRLGNFGAFDPELNKRNISGLGHSSKLDEEIWREFHKDWDGLITEAHQIKVSLARIGDRESGYVSPKGPSERLGAAKHRLHQSFFRDAVLSSYVGRCAVTGLAITECLIASHIVPWSESVEARANPTNGICLSATMDRLFDAGLLGFGDDYTIQLAPRIRNLEDQSAVEHVIRYHSHPMILPERFLPAKEFLAWHRENRLQSN